MKHCRSDCGIRFENHATLSRFLSALSGSPSIVGQRSPLAKNFSVVAAYVRVLSNGLNLLGIPSYYQQVIKGVVFILAVMLDLLTKRRR